MWCGPETQETQWIVGMVKDVLYNITPELCSFQYIHCDVQRVVNGDQAELGSHPWAGYSKKFNFLTCKKNLPHSVSLEQESGAYFCGGSIISNRFGSLMVHPCLDYTLMDYTLMDYL